MTKIIDINKLSKLFDMMYVFKEGRVDKYFFGRFKLSYQCSSQSCSCYAQTDCKHRKMLRGDFELKGESSDYIDCALSQILKSFGIKYKRSAGIKKCGSVELKLGLDYLVVGIKGQLVVYIK